MEQISRVFQDPWLCLILVEWAPCRAWVVVLSAEPRAWLFLSFPRVRPSEIQTAPRLLKGGASSPFLCFLLFFRPTQNSSNGCLSQILSPSLSSISACNIPPCGTFNHGSPPVAFLLQQRVSSSLFLQLREPSHQEQRLLLFFFRLNLGKVPITF